MILSTFKVSVTNLQGGLHHNSQLNKSLLVKFPVCLMFLCCRVILGLVRVRLKKSLASVFSVQRVGKKAERYQVDEAPKQRRISTTGKQRGMKGRKLTGGHFRARRRWMEGNKQDGGQNYENMRSDERKKKRSKICIPSNLWDAQRV